MENFCRRHPRFSIPNLILYVIAANVGVFLLDSFSDGWVSQLLYFNREAILHGQVWRILTFVAVPDSFSGAGLQFSDVLFFAISMYFYYFIGSTLERYWGSAKFTIFYCSGVLFNILIGFVLGLNFGMTYVHLSLFFAFATLFPDMQILLFFLIPVKIKWLALLSALFFVLKILTFLFSTMPLAALIPLAAILNYLLFFSGDLIDLLRRSGRLMKHNTKHQKKTIDFKAAQRHAQEKKGYLHKCAVCGRTDVTNPELEFRYCSKCKGYYCYCSEHLNSHVHIE